MFRKKWMLFGTLFLTTLMVDAQDRYYTRTGVIQFFSKAPLEDIEAKNKTVLAALDTKSGALQFSLQMKSFEFEKALMQQHFNDNYVESHKYPKSEFKGTISNFGAVDFAKNGTYPVKIKGKLTLRNVTKDIEVPGTIKVEGDKIEATSTFNILLSDYKIAIPSPVKDKLSNQIRISVETKLDPLKG